MVGVSRTILKIRVLVIGGGDQGKGKPGVHINATCNEIEAWNGQTKFKLLMGKSTPFVFPFVLKYIRLSANFFLNFSRNGGYFFAKMSQIGG